MASFLTIFSRKSWKMNTRPQDCNRIGSERCLCVAKSPSASKSRFPWAHTMPSSAIIFSLISLSQRSDGAFCDLTFARCGTMCLEHATKKTGPTLIFHPTINCNRQRRLFQKRVPAVRQRTAHLQRVRGNPDLHWALAGEKFPVRCSNSPQNPQIMPFWKEESQPNVIERFTVTLTMGILAPCPVLGEGKDNM